MPLKDGQLTLPDKHWWRPGLPCNRIEPNFKTQEFACVDEAAPNWVKSEFRWTLQGKSANPDFFDDMLVVQGAERQGEFVIGATGAE